jgi:hypothetical protein
MEQPDANAEIVRRAYAAFNSADIDTLNELMAQTITWHTPGRSAIAGDHRGRDATFTQFGTYGGQTAGTFKATLLDVASTGDGVVVGLHHNTGERNGKQLDVYCAIVFEVEDGRITDGREHFFDLYAWDEFWA